MSSLSLEEAVELLAEGPRVITVEQYGPLRWFDREMRCASKGCSSPTHCRLMGVPYCHMHALRSMNEMLIEKGVLE